MFAKRLQEFNAELRDHFLQRTIHLLVAVYIFFTCATVIALSLYGIGNFQEFTEASQVMLLNITQIMGIVAVVISFYYILFLVYWGISRHEFPVQRLFAALFVMFVNVAFSILAILIQEFTQGV